MRASPAIMAELHQFPSSRAQQGTISSDVADPLQVLRASKDPMWIFDTETLAFLEVNDAAVQRYGYTREQFLRMTILDIRPVEDVALLLRNELRDRKHSADGERWRHKTRTGKVFDVRITSHELLFRNRVAEIVTAELINPKPSGLR